MISVIVCSNQENKSNTHRRHVELTIGFPHEYIRIDNTKGEHSLCSAYNKGVSMARGDFCVFVHEDVFFLTPAWGGVLWRKFSNSRTGVVGVAGTQLLLSDNPRWYAAGPPFIRGQVLHHDADRVVFTAYSNDVRDTPVVVLDGLFLAVRRDLFRTVSFDETTFKGFHFYDLDLCMQARRTHAVIVTCDILVKHLSKGRFDDAWERDGKKFLEKYRAELPASTLRAVRRQKQGPDAASPASQPRPRENERSPL